MGSPSHPCTHGIYSRGVAVGHIRSYPLITHLSKGGTVAFMHSGKERNQFQNPDVYPI